MMMLTKMTRRAALLLTTGFVVGAVGCNDFLRVQNPGAIEAPDINNPAYIPLLVNGVIGEFQPAFTLVALYSGVFTDELANFHGFPENIDMDVRNVGAGNGTYTGTSTLPGVYNSLQSSRFMADTVSVLLRSFLGEAATRDVRLARVLNYAGYSYTLLGEQLCAAPTGGNTIYTSDELLTFALERFKSAIDVATASKAAGGGVAADSMLTLARLGAARVSLDLGKKADAITYASLVDTAFSASVYHAAANAREVNPFFGAASNGPNAEWVGITNTPFATVINDPRIPHPPGKEKTQQDSAVVPNSPRSYSTFDSTARGADFTREASVKFASGLEARYILAEAQGNNPTNLKFLNDRRSIGGALPLVAPTEAEFQAALREQRARDLYLANYRMGDLRRYKKLYQVDLWQKGPYVSPVAAPPTFGTQECWPIPLAEYNGNPNLPRP